MIDSIGIIKKRLERNTHPVKIGVLHHKGDKLEVVALPDGTLRFANSSIETDWHKAAENVGGMCHRGAATYIPTQLHLEESRIFSLLVDNAITKEMLLT